MPGIPGIDGIGIVQEAACEQGQVQLPPHAVASLAEQSKPQHPNTVVATIFNILKVLCVVRRLVVGYPKPAARQGS
jgi:hypothetical protein